MSSGDQPGSDALPWTDDRVQRLKTGWAAGHTCSQLARDLGGGLTRSAIIGKVNRLGLRKPDAAATRSAASALHAKARTREGPARPIVAPAGPPTRRTVQPPAGARNTHLVDLTETTCRAPTNDPPQGSAELMTFCGAPVARREGKPLPYCPSCCSRMYVGWPRHGAS